MIFGRAMTDKFFILMHFHSLKSGIPQSDYWSGLSIGDHIFLHVWKWVQVTVHVWPSSIFSSFIYQMLISMLLHELLFLFSQFNFVVKEMLSIRKILDSPLVLFTVFIFLKLLGDFNLLFSWRHDVFLLSLSKTFKMIRNESMRSKLRSSGCFVLSHDITHVSSIDFMLVHFLLILSPVGLSISLLLSLHFVIFLHLFQLLVLLHSDVIFHHSSGSSESFSLSGIFRFLLFAVIIFPLVLSLLLLYPFLLEGSISINSCSVVY